MAAHKFRFGFISGHSDSFNDVRPNSEQRIRVRHFDCPFIHLRQKSLNRVGVSSV
jgi:hypothetical protein